MSFQMAVELINQTETLLDDTRCGDRDNRDQRLARAQVVATLANTQAILHLAKIVAER